MLMESNCYPDEGIRNVFRVALLRNWQRRWDTSSTGRGFLLFILRCLSILKPGLQVFPDGLLLVDSELCVCGAVETLEHFWLHCRLYSSQRSMLVDRFVEVLCRPVVPSVLLFLGFSGSVRSRGKRRSLGSALLQYLRDTGRFDFCR